MQQFDPNMADVRTVAVDGHYLVSRPSTGAVSLFTPAEYLVFMCLLESDGSDPAAVIRRVMGCYGCSEDQVVRFTGVFLKKLEQQGWTRTQREELDTPCLQSVYLSITTGCNLTCNYCYIGDSRRHNDQRMPPDHALRILDKIKAFGADPGFAVTGGEPFTHPGIFVILDALEQRSLRFTIGSNATLIDGPAAAKLKNYMFLDHIQVSIDGMTPEVHALTRGDTWHATISGIRNLITEGVPFSLAPTLHSGNLHEVTGIARFARENGGYYAPNHLRRFPHAPNLGEISLSPCELRNSIIGTFGEVKRENGRLKTHGGYTPEHPEARQQTRRRHVCGNAWYSVDIDWNGDVYPCHLLREKEFIIGNILTEEIPVIMERGKRSRTRVKAYDIPGCRECPFVATCAGGCRASGYYHKGTFAAADEFCEILHQFEIDKLFYAKDPTGYIPPLAMHACVPVNPPESGKLS
jgi:radical SAM protein with 4Fe4S-binding SPASM domain